MEEIRFNDGTLRFAVNGDENRIASFNPADPAIASRVEAVLPELYELAKRETEDSEIENMTDEQQLSHIAKYEREISENIKSKIDYIFNGDVSAAMFGNASPLAEVNGEPLFCVVVDALYKKCNETQKNAAKKYTGKYRKRKRRR